MSTIPTDNNKNKNCKICNSTNSVIFDYKTDESVCNVCGAVIPADDDEELLGHQQTPRYGKSTDYVKEATQFYREEEHRINKTHGLTTVILPNAINVKNDGVITNEQRQHAHRLKFMNNVIAATQSTTTSKKSLIRAVDLLLKLKSELNLTESIIDRATSYFKKLQKHHFIKGRSIEAAITICLYIVFKEFNLPRTLEEIAFPLGIAEFDITSIRRYYRKALKLLSLNFNTSNCVKDNNPKFLNKYLKQLDLPFRLYSRAAEIYKIVTTTPPLIAGLKPSILELTILYYVYREDLDTKQEEKKRIMRMEEFALLSSTNSVTMRKDMKIIKQKLAAYEENN
jgi:transcription initiation factor TFIIIB Brf1 subunit/transcription initiation factor TFIIB